MGCFAPTFAVLPGRVRFGSFSGCKGRRQNIMKTQLTRLLAVLLNFMAAGSTFDQGTASTYQGQLNDSDDNGQRANGIYDLQFTIYETKHQTK
jgi:hypothetical protein